MKINNNPQRKKKKLFLPLLIVAILLSSWLVFAYIKSTWPFTGETRDNTTTEQTISPEEQKIVDSENAQQKQDFLDDQVKEEKDKTTNPDKTKDNTQKDDSKINLTARTQDNQLVVTTELTTITSGECKLTLKQGEKSVWKTANVIFAPNSSTCEGFSIDKSELGSGPWKITLSVKTADDTFTKSINYDL